MNSKVQRLTQASIIIGGTITNSLIFKNLHPVISLISMFTLSQFIYELICHIKEIRKIGQTYGGALATSFIKAEFKKMIVDIITLSLWFLIMLGIIYWCTPWL